MEGLLQLGVVGAQLADGPGVLEAVSRPAAVDRQRRRRGARADGQAARAGAALTVANRDSSTLPGLATLSRSLREFGVTQVGAVLNVAARQ